MVVLMYVHSFTRCIFSEPLFHGRHCPGMWGHHGTSGSGRQALALWHLASHEKRGPTAKRHHTPVKAVRGGTPGGEGGGGAGRGLGGGGGGDLRPPTPAGSGRWGEQEEVREETQGQSEQG